MVTTVFRIITWLSLIVLLLPSILYLAGTMELPQVKTWMIWSTIVWFGVSIGHVYFTNSN